MPCPNCPANIQALERHLCVVCHDEVCVNCFDPDRCMCSECALTADAREDQDTGAGDLCQPCQDSPSQFQEPPGDFADPGEPAVPPHPLEETFPTLPDQLEWADMIEDLAPPMGTTATTLEEGLGLTGWMRDRDGFQPDPNGTVTTTTTPGWEPDPFRPDDAVTHFDPRHPSPYAQPWALAVAVAQGAVPAAWIATLQGAVPAAWFATLSSHVPAIGTAIALFTGFKAAEVVNEGAEAVKASVTETIAVGSIHVEETIGAVAHETQEVIGLAGMLARGLLVASAILTAAWIVRLLLVGRRTWISGFALVRAALRALRR